MTLAKRDEIRELPTVHALAIDEIRESPTNPRVISDRAVELVAESLQRFGWKQPIVVDRDRNIVVGHTRLRAAKHLGLAKVPVVIAEDLTPAEADAYRIVDNRTRDFTTWDLPALSRQLEDLSDEFADVLALADWEAVTAQFDALSAGAGGTDATDLDLPAEVENALDGGFIINVCFQSKEAALAAQPAIMDLPGVFDVRHDF